MSSVVAGITGSRGHAPEGVVPDMFGARPSPVGPLDPCMPGFPSFGASADVEYASDDRFHPDVEPEPGEFLDDGAVLAGRDHAALHRLSRMCFERRGVYDMTFGYNLARLNLDPRHPDAGFRYAREADDPSTLRAEFTPTTEFCPQSDTLTLGAFRAWNGETASHEFDLVRVRVDRMHHQSMAINGTLEQAERRYRETGELAPADSQPSTPNVDAPF
jgi:hypothetical protein